MYYYVDHTSRFDRNTGIQRCVRAIASALIKAGVPLRPVVWNRQQLNFQLADQAALHNLSGWHGPGPETWTLRHASCGEQRHPADGWLLIVELISGPYQPTASELHQAAARYGLRVAWVFHDAIPWRWSHLYGARAQVTASCHAAYMKGLAMADLVLANSNSSADQLCEFLADNKLPYGHVQALPLASEFPGVPRLAAKAQPKAQEKLHHLLSVGSLEPRKNHVALIKAIAWLHAHACFPAQLIIAGWPNQASIEKAIERARSLGLPLHLETQVDDQHLIKLYQWSDSTIVVSLDEGFGLTLAESIWFRRPCLHTPVGALAEVSRPGGCLAFQGSEWFDLSIGLAAWLTDEQLRLTTQAQLLNRRCTTWLDYAQDLCQKIANAEFSDSER